MSGLSGLCILAGLFYGTLSFGTVLRTGVISGVMQQPSSQYFHGIYGGQFDLGLDSELILLRGSYLERPAFRSAGFEDQERGAFGFIGTKLTKSASSGFYGFAGYGAMWGYTKSLDENPSEDAFRIPGPILGLEYALQFGAAALQISHMTFLGYRGMGQLSALVSWPYTYLCLNVSYQLGAGKGGSK